MIAPDIRQDPPTGIELRQALLTAIEGAMHEQIDASGASVVRMRGTVRVNSYPSREPLLVTVDHEYRTPGVGMGDLAGPTEQKISVDGSFGTFPVVVRESDDNDPVSGLLRRLGDQLAGDDSFVPGLVYPEAEWSIRLDVQIYALASALSYERGSTEHKIITAVQKAGGRLSKRRLQQSLWRVKAGELNLTLAGMASQGHIRSSEGALILGQLHGLPDTT